MKIIKEVKPEVVWTPVARGSFIRILGRCAVGFSPSYIIAAAAASVKPIAKWSSWSRQRRALSGHVKGEKKTSCRVEDVQMLCRDRMIKDTVQNFKM